MFPVAVPGRVATLLPNLDEEENLLLGFVYICDVDAAMGPRVLAVLTSFATVCKLGGAGILLGTSPPRSTSVFRALAAGSGTVTISEGRSSIGIAMGVLRPEGLCFAVVDGGCISLRAFIPDSGSSASARGGGLLCGMKLPGGIMPERFMTPCSLLS